MSFHSSFYFDRFLVFVIDQVHGAVGLFADEVHVQLFAAAIHGDDLRSQNGLDVIGDRFRRSGQKIIADHAYLAKKGMQSLMDPFLAENLVPLDTIFYLLYGFHR